MNQDHEYSILGGLNRAKIGHSIGMVAAIVASSVVTLFLAAVNFFKELGWVHTIPPVIFWPVTASVIYGLLYWLFDRHIWRIPKIAALLRVPDLSGTWHCIGQSINMDKSLGHPWEGEVVIVQSWDRIRVRLKTKQSGSNSMAAALVYDAEDGFRLMYSYRNDPKISEAELTSHRGYAELTFDKDLNTAEGEYFNGQGRYTFGTMKLKKF